MAKIIVIVDCQKDFIDGSLGTPEAQAMIPVLKRKINAEPEDTMFIFTADTHDKDYMNSPEGKQLPVEHCIKNTPGWEIEPTLAMLFGVPLVIEKPTFGSYELISYLEDFLKDNINIDTIEFVGLVTNICVISNALMTKSKFPNIKIVVDANCCAGTTPEKHAAALEVMKSCQIIVI